MKHILILLVTFFSMSVQAQDSNKGISNAEGKTSKSILVVTGLPDPNESEALAYYSERAKKLFAEAGGKPISKYKVKEQLYGDNTAALIFVAEFPNDQAIKNFFNSKAYKTILPYRNKAFTSLNIYIVNQ